MNMLDINHWLIPLNKASEEAKKKIIFFPHAGGNAYSFNQLVKQFDCLTRLFAIELPGKGHRIAEEPFHNFNVLIDSLMDVVIQTITPNTLLFGHSMGALVAFECARKIILNYKKNIKALIVSGQAAPSYQLSFLKPHLSDIEMIKHLSLLQEIPKAFLDSPELMQMMLDAVRADCCLVESYIYQTMPHLQCPIICFIAKDDPIAKEEQYNKWRVETKARFIPIYMPGGHFSLLNGMIDVSSLLDSILEEPLCHTQ